MLTVLTQLPYLKVFLLPVTLNLLLSLRLFLLHCLLHLLAILLLLLLLQSLLLCLLRLLNLQQLHSMLGFCLLRLKLLLPLDLQGLILSCHLAHLLGFQLCLPLGLSSLLPPTQFEHLQFLLRVSLFALQLQTGLSQQLLFLFASGFNLSVFDDPLLLGGASRFLPLLLHQQIPFVIPPLHLQSPSLHLPGLVSCNPRRLFGKRPRSLFPLLLLNFNFPLPYKLRLLSLLLGYLVLELRSLPSLQHNERFPLLDRFAFGFLLSRLDLSQAVSLLLSELSLPLLLKFKLLLLSIALLDLLACKLLPKHLLDFQLLSYFDPLQCLFLHFDHCRLWYTGAARLLLVMKQFALCR